MPRSSLTGKVKTSDKVVQDKCWPSPTRIWIIKKVRKDVIVKKLLKSTKTVFIKNDTAEVCNLCCYLLCMYYGISRQVLKQQL